MSLVEIVKEGDIQTSLRMSKELLKRAKRYALEHDTSLAALVVDALESYLNKKEK
jgi:predicted DNA-binding protein